MALIDCAESALLPDWLIRVGIRRLLAGRLRAVTRHEVVEQQDAERQFVRQLRQSPIAIDPELANVQHYEVPTRFFQQVLGPRLKYSCCYYARTLEDWLHRSDARRGELRELFQADLGPVKGKLQFQRWRLFFMACAELFAYRGGNEWFVAHYLFGRRKIG